MSAATTLTDQDTSTTPRIMSEKPVTTDAAASPAYAVNDSAETPAPVASTNDNDVEAQPTKGEATSEAHVHPLAQLGSVRKGFLLFIFAVASFV